MTTDAVELRRIEATHPLRGFLGMLGMELRIWFPWRYVVLTAAGAGVFAVVYVPWTLAEINQFGNLLYFFYGLWLAVMLLATVSLTEGSVLGEIEDGTAAWLVAMPIARPAVILAKYVATLAGITATVFTVGIAVYPLLDSAAARGITEFNGDELTNVLGGPIGHWGRFTELAEPGEWTLVLAATAMLLAFVAAVMMLFGTVLRSRTLVFGLGLVVVGIFGGLAAAGSFAEASPAGLIGGVVDALQAKSATFATPLVATGMWTVPVVAIAVWRFERKELP